MSKKPRLTHTDRLAIEQGLNARKSCYKIATELDRPIKTILREIAARSKHVYTGAPGRVLNRCKHSRDCRIKQLCAHCQYDTRRACRLCNKCNEHCKAFEEMECPKLAASAHAVCNGCADRSKCVLRKRFYKAGDAHDNYTLILSESRSGITVTEEELAEVNRVLVAAKDNGQSVYAVMQNNPGSFNVSLNTVYRWVREGLLDLRTYDLSPKLIGKRKHVKSIQHKVDPKCRIGRTYKDYTEFMRERVGFPVTEMDTVEGRKGESVLLTWMFMPHGFMVATLLEHKYAKSVNDAFNALRAMLIAHYGSEKEAMRIYRRLFGIILTDNGTEFSDPSPIECGGGDTKQCNLFYCEPCASWQKAHVENNHLLIRRVLPKGNQYLETTSFAQLTQKKVDLMMSHVNSYVRESLDGATPYDLFVKEHGVEVATLLGISKIPADKVMLKPALLGIVQKVRQEKPVAKA